MQLLILITVSMWIGMAFGAWLLIRSINYLLSRGVMDIYYNGKRAEVFRMW